MSAKKIKTIRSHSGLARWIAQLDERPVGFLARVQVEDIKSPYASNPAVPIYRWRSSDVIWFETAHKVYQVFEIAPTLLRFKTPEIATDWHIRFSR